MRAYGRWWCVLIGVALCTVLLPVAVSAGQSRTFPETGQTSSNAFYDFWLSHGQLEILGLPLSPVFRAEDVTNGGKATVFQVYERAMMEWHPENTRENRVQLRRLGAVVLFDGVSPDDIPQDLREPIKQVRSAPPRPCASGTNCETFTATNHTMLGVFRDYWYAHGGLATFGYPLTEELPTTGADDSDKNVIVQYFERFALEWHPSVKGGTVLLRRLGAVIYGSRIKDLSQDAVVGVPDYDNPVPFLNS